MRRISIAAAVVLSCGPPRPDVQVQQTKAEPVASGPAPVATDCRVAVLELVVVAPREMAVFVDSPTLPLARREVAAGTEWRTTLSPAPTGVHMIVVRDAQGEVVSEDDLPVIVMAGERHRWQAGAEAPRHRIERCTPAGTELLQAEDAEIPTMGWGPPLISADGTTLARLATYTKSGSVVSDLALVEPVHGFRRVPLLASETFALKIDAGVFATAGELLRTGGFRRLAANELLAAPAVETSGEQLRVRLADRTGAVALPPVPAESKPGCCTWQTRGGLGWGTAPVTVVAELALACDTEKAACEDEYTYDAPYSQALLAVPLTADAAKQALTRP